MAQQSITRGRAEYIYQSSQDIEDSEFELCCDWLQATPGEKNLGVLGGRSYFTSYESPDLGSLIIKRYQRGGIWGKFVGSTYLHSAVSRGDQERRALERCLELGIPVPKPFFSVVIYRLGVLYRSWLVMQDIGEHETLASLSLRDPESARERLEQVKEHITALIKNQILHIDLHPGNVVVAGSKIFIIDFDKAVIGKYGEEQLKGFYLRRWRRAVIKHRLPEFLSEHMCYILRSKS